MTEKTQKVNAFSIGILYFLMMFSRKFRSGSECDNHDSECDNHGSECDNHGNEYDKRGSECDKRGSEKERKKTAEKGQILRKNDYLCKMKE